MIQGSMLVQRCQNKGKSTKSEYNRPKSNLIMLGRKPRKKISYTYLPAGGVVIWTELLLLILASNVLGLLKHNV